MNNKLKYLFLNLLSNFNTKCQNQSQDIFQNKDYPTINEIIFNQNTMINFMYEIDSLEKKIELLEINQKNILKIQEEIKLLDNQKQNQIENQEEINLIDNQIQEKNKLLNELEKEKNEIKTTYQNVEIQKQHISLLQNKEDFNKFFQFKLKKENISKIDFKIQFYKEDLELISLYKKKCDSLNDLINKY